MKRNIKSLLLGFLAVAAMTSCDSYNAPEVTSAPALTVLSRETNFPAGPSTGTITFKADGNISVSSPNQWINASVSGNTITVTVDQNNGLTSRTGVVTATNGVNTTDISIYQEGVLFKFIGDGEGDGSTDLVLTAQSGTSSYEVSTNIPLEISSDSEWLSATTQGNELLVSVLENPSLDDRTGTLTIQYGNSTAMLNVTQSGIYIELFDMDEWDIPSDVDSTMDFDFPYSTIPVNVESSDDWISYTFVDGVISITAEENTTGTIREGSFNYSVGEKTGTVNVSQCSIDTDLLGSGWTIQYYTGSTKATSRTIACELVKEDDEYFIGLTTGGVDLLIPVEWDADTRIMSVWLGGYCGRNGSNYVYTCFGYINATGGSSYNHASQTQYKMEATPTLENGVITMPIEDCGLNAGFPYIYIRLTNYSSNTSWVSGTQVSALLSMYYPTLVR